MSSKPNISAVAFQRRQFSSLTVAALALALSVASPVQAKAAAKDGAANQPDITGKVTNAIEKPLHDINLMRTEIPGVLQDAHRAPYAPIVAPDCGKLGSEIASLDEALGRDLDAAAADTRSGKDRAIDKAIDVGGSAASSFIPYRGVVRFVSGAEKHDKLVAGSILAGSIRRAYLKGVGESLGCSYPGAPLRTVSENQD
jgi:hypothetical protein